MNIEHLLKDYDFNNITIGVLGGHSGLEVCAGAKKHGFKTLAVVQKGREKTYTEYYKSNPDGSGCVDDVIVLDSFADISKEEVQAELRARNTIFIQNRYFWVYCNFREIEQTFQVPIYGSRELLKLEERDHPENQYVMLEKAGIRIPKIFSSPEEIDRLAIVKVNEAERTYERAFFVVANPEQYKDEAEKRIASGHILRSDLEKATIEEFVIGAQINFNYFYSNVKKRLELMGTDIRRQTSLDGFLRLDAESQLNVLKAGYKPTMVETGHIAVTIKESLVEKAFEAGKKFVATSNIIGPFALQGAISSDQGKEEVVIFDVSMRIPGSPGTAYTPYTRYLNHENLSYGERIAIEIKQAIENKTINNILT
jgi:5-formaminoimidazole-4-carboxamide-1-(beta)-D-ribofuranosyl 5'-monophosphate synthetase